MRDRPDIRAALGEAACTLDHTQAVGEMPLRRSADLVTGQALGLLMERYRIDEHRALALLGRAADDAGAELGDVAAVLVEEANAVDDDGETRRTPATDATLRVFALRDGEGRGFAGAVGVGDKRAYRTMASYLTEDEALQAAQGLVGGALEKLLAAQEWRDTVQEWHVVDGVEVQRLDHPRGHGEYA